MSIFGLETELPVFPRKRELRAPKIEGMELDEYIRVCDEIGGISCADLTSARVTKCLREEGIEPFAQTQVVNYLDSKLGKEWEWFGLRKEDVDHLAGWVFHSTGARDVKFATTQYLATVPYPVLLTIAKIKAAAPGAFFYVSGQKVPEGDPFLMVTARGMSAFIVECWDEPAFRRK